MEFLSALLAGGLVEISKCFCGSMYPKIKSIVKVQSNFDNLGKEMENLKSLKSRILEQMEVAEREGHRPRPTVVEWFKEVEEMEKEVNLIQERLAPNDEARCNCCPSCRFYSKPAMEVAKRLNEVKLLVGEGSFPSGMLLENQGTKQVEHVPVTPLEGQSTASKNLDEVLQLLGDDGVGRIGIWGMGGVGKTTLVKNLNNKLKTASLPQPFTVVIFVTVSKQFSVKEVQAQIAARLNLEVNQGESVERTASRLYERLKKEKRFLLFLDDVWESIDVDLLGVPQPRDHPGSKIVLTSRSFNVCRHFKTDAEVKVTVLNEEESWHLFIQHVGKVVELEDIKPFGHAVVRECCGLPLSIIVVGASMRGKTMVELWKDVLNALQVPSVPHIDGVEEKVYKSLKLSYDSLQGMHIKSIFLYCSLYPEDYFIQIRELVQAWLAEGLIDELQNYESSFNRGIALVENLKDACLLEQGFNSGTVKMHDVVRDVAIWFSSSLEDGCKSLVRSGIGLMQFPNIGLFDSVKRVSLMQNKIFQLPDCMTQCPEVFTLLLQVNRSLKIVPEGFLLAFKALKILDMSYTGIQALPVSLLQLGELRALLLGHCSHLKELPSLGELSRLQVLDCTYTAIKELPEGMEKLINLRHLDLSDTFRLKSIQPEIISKLSSLEVLKMRKSGLGMNEKLEIQSLQRVFTPFNELDCLDRLSVLSTTVFFSSLAFENLEWVRRLKKFDICIYEDEFSQSPPVYSDPGYEKRASLFYLRLSGRNFSWLLSNVNSLCLFNCSELEKITASLGEDYDFQTLRSIRIAENADRFALRFLELCETPNLEVLQLTDFVHLECIPFDIATKFPKLRVLKVASCHNLKYLLSVSGSNLPLKNLEEVSVMSCICLEELFVYPSSSQYAEPCLNFPSLQNVGLYYLPKLRSLCRQEDSWQKLKLLEVVKCPEIKKLPLTTQSAESLEGIAGDFEWWRQLQWDDESTKSSLQQYFAPFPPFPST